MLLQQLSDAFGVTGAEGDVRDILVEAVRPHVDDVRIDSIGNLIATKGPRPPAAGRPVRVMLAAHMDEVGLMITHIEKGGLLKFRPAGGIDPRLLAGKQLVVGPKRTPGVIGIKPIHLTEPDERKRAPKIEQLSIDIGATSRDKAERLVKVGDFAAFATKFSYLGNGEAPTRMIKGKALDDRAGCYALARLLEEDYPVELVAVFTVQEEVGLRGARVAAYALEPDLAIVLEGTICDDLPKDKEASPVTRVGKGPAITIADRSFISDRRLVKLLVDAAEEHQIPYQFKEPGLGGTDAGAIHLTRAGVPAVAIATPCRYIHAPASVASLDDLDNEIALLKHVLPRLAEWPALS